MLLRLDTLAHGFRGAARRWVALTAIGVLSTGAASAEILDGVQFPDRTSKVGERRYRVPQDWENTMKYFKTAYPSAQYPRHMIVNQPGVVGGWG